jgi:two-component system, OmpR family, sensor kinase
MRKRLVQGSIAVVTLGMLLLTAGIWLVLQLRLDADVQAIFTDRASSVSALLSNSGGTLAVAETRGDEALETGFWLFDRSGRVVTSPSANATVEAAAQKLAARGSGTVDASSIRLSATPAMIAKTRVGSIVIGVPLAPYHDALQLTLIGISIIDVVVIAGIATLTRITVRRALAPVGAMSAAALDWSEHDLDRRLPHGSEPDELGGLATTLNTMLGRVSSSLRHEQRVSAEIAHELKTPLARIHSIAETALRHGIPADRDTALADIGRETMAMASIVDTLLSAHREPAIGSIHSDANEVLLTFFEHTVAAGNACEFIPAIRETRVLCDGELLLRIVTPIVANAQNYANSRVTVRLAEENDFVTVSVEDDGPGFLPEDVDHVLRPGYRGRNAGDTGSGLGLSLSSRLVRSAGGRLEVFEGPGGRVHILIPSAR